MYIFHSPELEDSEEIHLNFKNFKTKLFYNPSFCMWFSVGIKILSGCVGGFSCFGNGENMRCCALGSGMRAIITDSDSFPGLAHGWVSV